MCPFVGTESTHYKPLLNYFITIAVILCAVNVASTGGSGGSCPAKCRCLERSTVVTCTDLVHVSPIPSSAVVLNLDHNRISLLYNSSFRGAETSSDGGAWTALRRLEILSVEDNGLLFIEVGALSTLYELRELRLGRNHLSRLPRDLLAANRKLQVLDLHANYLATIPDGVVRHAHGLIVLNVSFNHLTSARLGDGFRHINQLSVIDLSGNDLPTIDVETFAVMQWWDDETPRHINLSYCNVRHIRPLAFRPVPRLATINLDGNPRLPQDQLETALAGIRNQPTLNVIRLSHGNITDSLTLVRQLQSATNLTRLELSHNRIRTVGKRTFFFLSSLRHLDLSHNEISSIDGFSGGLARLEYLDLSFNCLERFDASTFEGLHELRVLDVSHNSLTGDVDAQSLLGLFNLHSIDISFNRISSIRIDDGGLESLETLSAAWNRIADLSFMSHLPRLQVIDLSHNAIESVPDDLLTTRSGGLTTINKVNLSGNSIADISAGAFRHSTINVIDLSYNRLTTLSNYGWRSTEKQSAGSGVRTLIVTDNFIANISDDAFDGLETMLAELRLERNSLGSLPMASSLVRMRQLRLLDVSWNPLGKFLETTPPSSSSSSSASAGLTGHDVGVLPQLESFRLNDVGLTSWPAAIFGDAQLHTLDLTGNRLRSVPDDALVGLRKLRRLNLSRNRLSTFDPQLAGLTAVKSTADSTSSVHVDLFDNPLDCSCALEPLCRHLFPTTDAAAADDNDESHEVDAGRRGLGEPRHRQTDRTFRCRTPNEWSNVPLREFCADTVQCSRLTTTVAAGVGAFISIIVALLVAGFCFHRLRNRCRWIGASKSSATRKRGIYTAGIVGSGTAGDGGKAAKGRCRLDNYQFVVDETTLTSSSNSSSASSNTTTTCTNNGQQAPAASPPAGALPGSRLSTTFDGNTGGNLKTNLLLTKQWL